MKLLMDSDCLIKLTKASLKEVVCKSFTVVIPPLVKKEVIDAAAQHPDAIMIRKNLEKKLLTMSKPGRPLEKGEEEVFAVFQSGGYDAICSDDRRFIKRLRMFQAPYLTPAVLIAVMLREEKITVTDALRNLESLSSMISEDEYFTVKAFLTNWRKP